MNNRTPFWRNSAARAALLYSGLYLFSSLLTFLVLYLYATHDLRAQLREAVQQDTRSLTLLYRQHGRQALAQGIDLLVGSVEAKRSLYLLEASDSAPVAGNVPHIDPFDGWKTLQFKYNADRSDEFFVFGQKLDDLWLFVGRREHNVSEIQEVLLKAFGLGTLVVVPIAAFGIIALTRQTSRRVETIITAMESYARNNLTKRVPIEGNGDEIDRLSLNINHVLERIEKLVDGIRQVTSDVAHDLRTPLSRLRQKLESVDQLWAGDLSPIADAINEVDTIIATFDALLQIEEIDAKAKRAPASLVALSEIGHFIAETYGNVAEDRGQKLTAEIEPGANLLGHKRLITQLLANLIENAIRHTPQGTTIDIAIRKLPHLTMLRVTDNGPGIPQGEREKVFDRFYRLDSSRSTPGSGLGLALVKSIVSLHDAKLALSDNQPGLSVTITFPNPSNPDLLSTMADVSAEHATHT